MPSTMPFRVVVTWNPSSGVQVAPEPVPTYMAVQPGDNAQITWVPANGTFPAPSTAFSWKGSPNPGWTPSESGGNLVSPVFNPSGQPNWSYNITITDNSGNNHTLDPEIENEIPPPIEEEIPPKNPPGQQGSGGPTGGGNVGGGNTGGGDNGGERHARPEPD